MTTTTNIVSSRRASAQRIGETIADLERRYETRGEYPPEHISMAASAAEYVTERVPGFTRQTIRDHLAPKHTCLLYTSPSPRDS